MSLSSFCILANLITGACTGSLWQNSEYNPHHLTSSTLCLPQDPPPLSINKIKQEKKTY